MKKLKCAENLLPLLMGEGWGEGFRSLVPPKTTSKKVLAFDLS